MTTNTEEWVSCPKPEDLIEGHEYLVVSMIEGVQRYPRLHRMSYLGPHSYSNDLQFNARPFAGTQAFGLRQILKVKDLGKSNGREDPERYMNKDFRLYRESKVSTTEKTSWATATLNEPQSRHEAIGELAEFLANETKLATSDPAAAADIAVRLVDAGWRRRK